ncbi:M23 family metallopeptidase [Pseudoalteromonas sp. P94(2023)]|uniref:M23 family metallopeptidase n=2 Tax=Pseudoalteromonas obscura TaxID=3048491 RepID=A0ABT7ET02_9GAMM|nr:M23 family metallopeptidase [Pseudoalteromonas sp. P94(2023)]
MAAALVVGVACTCEKVVTATSEPEESKLRSTVGGALADVNIGTNEAKKLKNITKSSIITLRLAAGENLIGVLRRYDVNTQQVMTLIREVQPWLDLNKLTTGKAIQLTLNQRGSLIAFSIGVRFATILTATLEDGDWQVRESTLESELVDEHIRINVGRSLYNSALDTGVAVDVIQRAIAVLSHRVDFQRSLQDTDVFEVFYQSTQLIDTHPLSKKSEVDKVNFIKLTVSGVPHPLYRYRATGESQHRFYYADGRPVQSFLLKTPLNGARLSSTFGRRKHPILGYSRLHKGLDFGAAIGTPIFSAGDGKVLKANWGGSFGNRIVIRHANGYQSLYAHLQGFATGIKAGNEVRQGEVIGYLGSTGLSQAPHLHFEVHKDGRAINPLTLKTHRYTARKLAGAKLEDFSKTVARIDAQLEHSYAKRNEPSQLVFNQTLKEHQH